MTVTTDRAALARVRGMLLGLGYRLTGTWADAEEAADEALARLVALDPDDQPVNVEAWLTTVATRLCLDRLRRRKREPYIGSWLPEPVDTALLPDESAEHRDDLRVAVLLAYEHLGENERAAYVLREAYGLAYAEIGDALDAPAATVRQWVSRARRRLTTDLAPPAPATDPHVEALVSAVFAGDLEATIAVLAPDVRVISDSDGKVNAARREITDPRKVAYFLVKSVESGGADLAVAEANGEVALVVRRRDVVRVVQLGVDDDKVSRLYFQCNPDKLRRLGLPEGWLPVAGT